MQESPVGGEVVIDEAVHGDNYVWFQIIAIFPEVVRAPMRQDATLLQHKFRFL